MSERASELEVGCMYGREVRCIVWAETLRKPNRRRWFGKRAAFDFPQGLCGGYVEREV